MSYNVQSVNTGSIFTSLGLEIRTKAKLLESSHAWLGASTSSIAADYTTLLKLKAPTWTRHDLQEAIEAVVTQKMRFTQASTKYGIPKGTLYDNILGKTKRMMVLEEAGLNSSEESAVLEFCCDISVSPYNRRTKKSLNAILNFVEKLRRKHSYQYQLQSMWQKCWNTNQSLVHNLRFRERGPLKSWRPETMAEAIFSVLKEGLSLSQAARKYDIPYPTFVLYANRVHNMLGPSADGGADLRPKGRGRPQRILLGVWPDEHIRGVIRAVVFRDGHSPHIVKEEPASMYPSLANYAACNGPEGAVSPGAAAAAAVAAVAQGLRHQMCSMVAAAHSQQHEMMATNLSTNLSSNLSTSLSSNLQAAMQASQHHHNSNNSGAVIGSNNGSGGGGGPGPGPGLGNNGNSPLNLGLASPGSGGPPESPMESPLASPLGPLMDPGHIPSSVEVGIGVSGMTYKPARSFVSPRPENLFQEDIADLVKSSHGLKDKDKIPVKLEPLTDSRCE